jgi:hypothetical protein
VLQSAITSDKLCEAGPVTGGGVRCSTSYHLYIDASDGDLFYHSTIVADEKTDDICTCVHDKMILIHLADIHLRKGVVNSRLTKMSSTIYSGK